MNTSPADSKCNDLQQVFLIGAPRSGTTWLQLLLAQHPETVTTSESHLFTQYLNLVETRWQYEKKRMNEGHKVNGLSQIIDDNRFYELIRDFSDGVFKSVHSNNLDATILIEKTPEHTLHADLLHHIYPEAYYLHIIRDPRAVVNSFSKAAKSWWAWTPSGPISVTQRWNKNIEGGRHFLDLTERYLEVRYEDLINNGASQLFEIWNWLGIQTDIEQCNAAVEACQIENLRSGSNTVIKPWALEKEPAGFFRKGGTDSWRHEMPRSHVATVEYIAKSHMNELDYTPLTKFSPVALIRYFYFISIDGIFRGFKYVCEGLEWRLRKVLSRL